MFATSSRFKEIADPLKLNYTTIGDKGDLIMYLPGEEQFTGSIIGQCLGDALGFPVEGYPAEACRIYVDDILKRGRAGEVARTPFPFGQYTDDSQLARELLESLLLCRGFDPEDYAGRIARIFVEERIVGRGRATEEAARRLAMGVPWQEAGTPPPSAGNGSAMRAGPVGLFYFNDPPGLVQAAVDQGRTTHKDKRSSAGAVAIAGSVALALRKGSIDREGFITELSSWVEGVEGTVARCIRELSKWLAMDPEDAARYIKSAGITGEFPDQWDGISPFVIPSVLWSVYSFLRTPEDYWETVCTAIRVGGDVDTTAAMAGAISGAYLGLGAIPQGLAHRLTDQGTWGFEELVELAGKCYRLKC
jgi:ADP-ribosylglycohydrolase